VEGRSECCDTASLTIEECQTEIGEENLDRALELLARWPLRRSQKGRLKDEHDYTGQGNSGQVPWSLLRQYGSNLSVRGHRLRFALLSHGQEPLSWTLCSARERVSVMGKRGKSAGFLMDQAVLDNYTPPKGSRLSNDDDWLDTRQPPFPYPDAEDLIRTYFESYLDVECLMAEKIAEWRTVLDQEKAIIKRHLRTISGLADQRTRWFCTEALKALSPQAKRMREALRQIARLERLRSAARRVFDIKAPVSCDAAFDDKVAQARQVAVLDVVSRALEVKKRGKSYTALCPFHDDRNPSLHI
jgi:hypothetical protein